jgi:hypothetical protein
VSNINEKIFTAQDLERAGTRGMIAGQIAIVEDIIKQARSDAQAEFNDGNDKEAVALREFATRITDLIGILNKKKDGLESKVRSSQIADTILDANLEVR